jgi:hypothetical protein
MFDALPYLNWIRTTPDANVEIAGPAILEPVS